MVKKIKIGLPKYTYKGEFLERFLVNPGTLDQTPEIEFGKIKKNNPVISFINGGTEKKFNIGEMELGFNLKIKEDPVFLVQPVVEELNDKEGKYLLVKWPKANYYQMDLEQLFTRLNGHIKWLDHVGVNIYKPLMKGNEFDELIKILAKSTKLIASPVNKNWLFVVPEGQKIGPLFEIVGDFKFPYPEIQIDIQTDLSAKEVIKMFPKPYGYYDPDPILEDYCVRVFVYTGWKNTSLRIDIRFQIADPNWRWKEWLIREGNRVIK